MKRGHEVYSCRKVNYMKNNLDHQENNEIIIAESKRENAILGKEASLAILSKINDTLNNLYAFLKL